MEFGTLAKRPVSQPKRELGFLFEPFETYGPTYHRNMNQLQGWSFMDWIFLMYIHLTEAKAHGITLYRSILSSVAEPVNTTQLVDYYYPDHTAQLKDQYYPDYTAQLKD